ncbi:MAG: DUF1501 domain-containing protein [Phycisphaera sp.]|nr:DUF1501 domain-containing protein [Phycisphaera sp.]
MRDITPDLSRRNMLRSLSSGFGYLAFAAMAAQSGARSAIAQAAGDDAASSAALLPRKPHFPARAKRVIFLCMKGGPSHVDTFDYKPDLNKRTGQTTKVGRAGGVAKLLGSPFKFAQHGESGLWLSELFPHLAQHADDLCLLNSMHTDLPNHPQAFTQLHTGSFQFVRPSLGAWTLYGLGSVNQNLPGFVTLSPPAEFGGATNYGSGFLPAICQGTKVGGQQLPGLYAALWKKDEEPGPPMKNIDNPNVSRQTQRAQLDLINALNERKLEHDGHHPEIEGAIESFELAFRMQSEVPHVLDMRDEPESIRAMYGISGQGDRFARQCLLARRLAEAGVRFVEVTAPPSWDHHRLLGAQLTKATGEVDRPIAALLADLKQRGMLDDTLVIWAGEFGRTPYAQSIDGRDHNNKGYTIWMAGGGTRGGLAHGATDEIGYEAAVKPVHIHDLHATILYLLGLDHERLTFNYAGRDFRLTDVYGDVAHDIVA